MGQITKANREELKQLLIKSVLKRTLSIPFDEENCAVSIMYSGGLDSSLIAAIVAKVLEPGLTIDLINVSFAPSTSADRITAIFSFHDLVKLYPERKLNLICADYQIEQVMELKESCTTKLLYPKNSHMDFNIGSALHFASKGEGYAFNKHFFDSDAFADL